MAGDPNFSAELMNARLNLLRDKLARLQSTPAPSTGALSRASSASRVLQEERRRNELLQQLRDEYNRQRNTPPAAPPVQLPPSYYYPPIPQRETRPKSNRLTEMMEAMMLQNAQVFQMMQQQMLLSNMNRPRSVRREPSYIPSPPAAFLPPPPNIPPMPAELPPLKPPDMRPLRPLRQYPFPGPPYLRRLRQLAYAALFVETLKSALTKGKKLGTGVLHLPDDFLIGVYIKEIISAIHQVYLDVRGPIYRLIDDFVIRGNVDYHLLTVTPKTLPPDEEQRFYESLTYLLETISYYITDIMPNRGVLGTHRKSALFQIMREYRIYPKKYLYETEKQLMTFDERGRTIRVNDGQMMMLLVGLFFVRSLATTILLHPLRYRLLANRTVVDQVVDTNLRFVATIIVFLYRVVLRDQDKRVMPMPKEIASELYTDAEMLIVYQRLKNTFDKCERYVIQWSQEYVRRLKAAAFTDPNAKQFDRNFYRRAAIQPVHDHPDYAAPAVRVRPPEVPPYPRNFNSVILRPAEFPGTESMLN